MKKLRYVFIFIVSYFNLLGERLWNRFWTTACLSLLFTALSLLNIPMLLGTTGHLALIGLFALALAGTLFYTQDPFSFPSRDDVDRHMEKVSALEHRPLETLHDKPAEGLSAAALGLWKIHLKKTARYIDNLRIYKPNPIVAQRDKYELRKLAVIFVAIGLMVAQGDTASRFREALTPDISEVTGKQVATLDLWITPPEYTHEPAIFLATAGKGLIPHENNILSVPQGSTLKLRVTGFHFAPRVEYASRHYNLSEPSPDSYLLDLPLQQSGKLQLTYLLSRIGKWQLTVAPDMPPEISIQATEGTPQSATKITYKATDDHGIAKITGNITLMPEMAVKLNAKPYRFNVSSPSSGVHVEDMASSLWAGMPVVMTLEAQDTAGHATTSLPASFTLPERHFTNMIAQKLIEDRKALFWNKNSATRAAVATTLADAAELPDLFKGDIITFMSLSMASRRLLYDGSDAAIASVQGLLWDVALKLEDGGLSLAQRELRDSLQRMSVALNDKSLSRQQMQDIIDDVQKKMQQYVRSLAMEMRQRLKQGKNMPVLSPDLAQKFTKKLDLGQLLEQMRRMAESNSREDLQKMADGMKSMLDNLNMNKFDQMQKKQMQAMQTLQNLEDIQHRQQALFDKTNKTKDPTEAKKQQKEQSELHKLLGLALGKLAGLLGNIPDNLGKAEQAMKLSGDALGEGQSKTSLDQQKIALSELKKGMDSMAEQMAQEMQQTILSFSMMPNGEGSGGEQDPLGRHLSDEGVKIPDEKERRRVQEIIQELRNRSNDPNRAKVERDYIDRLLDQF